MYKVVPEMGLEPIWISPFDFKSNAYTNSAIRAFVGVEATLERAPGPGTSA